MRTALTSIVLALLFAACGPSSSPSGVGPDTAPGETADVDETPDDPGAEAGLDQGPGDTVAEATDLAAGDSTEATDPATPDTADALDTAGDSANDIDPLDIDTADAPDTAGDSAETGDSAATDTADAVDPAPVDSTGDGETWTFDRDAYVPVRGWILLDRDPEAIASAIEAAAGFGVNHVQLSHDLIMDIDEIVGPSPEALARAGVLNDAIALAHARGMKAYVWAHELPASMLAVCYAPDGAMWAQREAAYRDGLARIPDVDGVVLMFGSAGASPWFTFCDCDWCPDTYGEDDFAIPPQSERIRLITEHVGRVVVTELGKELIARVFVHEPEESDWHAEGFAGAAVPFTGMHKAEVNDWQPYNPPDPTFGRVGPHASILEVDAAGEYWGQSILPFAAPGYFRYRLAQARERRGIGYVARVERGDRRALGTPNEVNLWALKDFEADLRTPIRTVWDDALAAMYGLRTDTEAATALVRILESTFPVRLKSHYALGIWALEKGSDLPDKPRFGEFFTRGKMPKWDPAWTGTWDALDNPDRGTLLRLWQEGSESVELADEARAALAGHKEALKAAGMSDAALDDLGRRLAHQAHAARAWRAVDLFLWASRAKGQGNTEPDLPAWMAFAVEELRGAASGMSNDGLDGVAVAGPARALGFAEAARKSLVEGVEPQAPPAALFSALRVDEVLVDRATLRFSVARDADVSIDVGRDLPAFGRVLTVGPVAAGVERTVVVDGLSPGDRWVARLRAADGEVEALGGEAWIFTPFAPPPR